MGALPDSNDRKRKTVNGLMFAIAQLPLSMGVIAIVVFSGVMSWLANHLIRRIWPPPAFKENHELVGFSYAVYGLIYGVMLAFTIIVAWERFAGTERVVMQEATIVSQLWRVSEALPSDIGEPIRKDLFAYTDSVIHQEWNAMAATGHAHSETEQIYEHLWTKTHRIHTETGSQQVYQAQFLRQMNELGVARRLRILHARMEVHSVLWLVLLVGALPTVAYTLLLSARHAWVQVLNTGFILLIVLMGLYVTLSLQYPFAGDVSIQPEAFLDLLDALRHRQLVPAAG